MMAQDINIQEKIRAIRDQLYIDNHIRILRLIKKIANDKPGETDANTRTGRNESGEEKRSR